MLLVVAESSGSSPGRQGFKMAVTADEMCGSIGGGVMEVNLVEQARALLSVPPGTPPAGGGAADASADGVVGASGGFTHKDLSRHEPTFLSLQSHQKNAPTASGMICSGKQTVIFKILEPTNAATINSIIDSIANRKPTDLIISPDKFTVRTFASRCIRFPLRIPFRHRFSFPRTSRP